jgi:uncharacterized membrane protein
MGVNLGECRRKVGAPDLRIGYAANHHSVVRYLRRSNIGPGAGAAAEATPVVTDHRRDRGGDLTMAKPPDVSTVHIFLPGAFNPTLGVHAERFEVARTYEIPPDGGRYVSESCRSSRPAKKRVFKVSTGAMALNTGSSSMEWLNLNLPATPALLAHIAGGTLAILFGFAALAAPKGQPVHRASGTAFFLAMLVMAISGLYLAVLKFQLGNIIAASGVLYLVSTAWVAAKRQDGESGAFEIGASIAAATIGVGLLALGVMARGRPELLDGSPSMAPFVFAGLFGLWAALDLSVVLRRGVAGVQRIARHLWRMTFGLFMAVGSFAIQGVKVLPPVVTQSRVLLFATLLTLVLLFFWLARVLFTKWHANNFGAKGLET